MVVVGREMVRVRVRVVSYQIRFDSSDDVGLFAVEVAVAVTGGAFEGVEGSFGSGRHELAAAVESMAANTDGVVLQTLPVPGLAVGGVVVVVPRGLRNHHGFS